MRLGGWRVWGVWGRFWGDGALGGGWSVGDWRGWVVVAELGHSADVSMRPCCCLCFFPLHCLCLHMLFGSSLLLSRLGFRVIACQQLLSPGHDRSQRLPMRDVGMVAYDRSVRQTSEPKWVKQKHYIDSDTAKILGSMTCVLLF